MGWVTLINASLTHYPMEDIVLISNLNVRSSNRTNVDWYLPYSSKHHPRMNATGSGHSVESPSMMDPPWNIWYWGSKWNLHTVCWDAVGCEWGTTSVYFGITYVCFILSRLPVFAAEPQYRYQDFFVKSIIWRTHTESSKNFMLV